MFLPPHVNRTICSYSSNTNLDVNNSGGDMSFDDMSFADQQQRPESPVVIAMVDRLFVWAVE